jgi:hypothetical protein
MRTWLDRSVDQHNGAVSAVQPAVMSLDELMLVDTELKLGTVMREGRGCDLRVESQLAGGGMTRIASSAALEWVR